MERELKHLWYVFLGYFIVARFHLRMVLIPDLENRLNRGVYLFLEKIDPSPRKKRRELDEDWYKRIDIKYALRNARFSYFQTSYLNYFYYIKMYPGALDHHPKAVQREFKELIREIHLLAYRCEASYRAVLERKRREETATENF